MSIQPQHVKTKTFEIGDFGQPKAEALGIMNDKKITCLFAVDDHNTPVGLIHIHDCLRAGVA